MRELGGLANQFFGYFEDIDWCWRAQLAGLRIRYEPAAVVRHAGGLSFGGMQSLRVRQLYGRNRLLCLVRNAPLGIARPERLAVEPLGQRAARIASGLAA